MLPSLSLFQLLSSNLSSSIMFPRSLSTSVHLFWTLSRCAQLSLSIVVQNWMEFFSWYQADRKDNSTCLEQKVWELQNSSLTCYCPYCVCIADHCFLYVKLWHWFLLSSSLFSASRFQFLKNVLNAIMVSIILATSPKLSYLQMWCLFAIPWCKSLTKLLHQTQDRSLWNLYWSIILVR